MLARAQNTPAAVAGLRGQLAEVAGWGRFPVQHAVLYRPERIAELKALVAQSPGRLLARGAGRAYGDAALNQDGELCDLLRLHRLLEFDPAQGRLRCEAGVTIEDLLGVFVPRGFFPPVTPGTKFVTLGGALAADVHGKNHHRDGSFGNFVEDFTLLTADGQARMLTAEREPELWRATVGGMGLTGIISEMSLRLLKIPSAYLSVETARMANLDSVLEFFEGADRSHRYSMAWIDSVSRGAALGRSIVTMGDFAAPAQLSPEQQRQPWHIKRRRRLALPFNLPGFALNSLVVRGFNAVYYGHHSKHPVQGIWDYDSFFYPLDSIQNWNRLYGRRGFVQYQCVWPLAQSRAGLLELLDAISASRRGSFLAVLKKFGPGRGGMLSFPMEGYTLALDFPFGAGLFELLDRLDQMVLERGGRVYLAKDSRLAPRNFRAMYPELTRWQEVRRGVDPNGHFSSSLSRRLGLDPA